MPKMKEKVQTLGIEDVVLFVGNVGNANEWYQAFDAFVLPSVWEGLPVVGVEAQAADLVIIASDQKITGMERFANKKVIRVDINICIKAPEAVLKKCVAAVSK